VTEQSSSELDLTRYVRQMRYPELGEDGQRALLRSCALVCGCGALGSAIAATLARAGVGTLRIVDRDFVELSNLQRQTLFDEDDVASGLPKAVAAANKLRRVNSQITIEPIVANVSAANIVELIEDVDVIVDGTDNFETRFLLNDAALKYGIPWVFGGCVGSQGQTMTILPRVTPCLRCVLSEPPPAGAMPTCDTAGILAPIVAVIAAIQSQEAIKILSGHRDAVQRSMIVVDLWTNQLRHVGLDALLRNTSCLACAGSETPWLDGIRGSDTTVLCGRNAVQISDRSGGSIALEELESRLRGVGRVMRNAFLLRIEVDGYVLTVFPDRRAIISGTDDPVLARSVYARYVGT
jgi:adenylyltransferase/sulfurtransferase